MHVVLTIFIIVVMPAMKRGFWFFPVLRLLTCIPAKDTMQLMLPMMRQPYPSLALAAE